MICFGFDNIDMIHVVNGNALELLPRHSI